MLLANVKYIDGPCDASYSRPKQQLFHKTTTAPLNYKQNGRTIYVNSIWSRRLGRFFYFDSRLKELNSASTMQ